MFGLGMTKPRRLDRFSSEHWVVVQGENGGAPMVLRINSGAAKYAAHPELPIRLGVTVAFNAPNEHGFCTPEEGEQLNHDSMPDDLQPMRLAERGTADQQPQEHRRHRSASDGSVIFNYRSRSARNVQRKPGCRSADPECGFPLP